MRKSPSGMVAVVVLLGCWSQSEAGDLTGQKLMADRKVAPEGADEGKPQLAPVAHLAIGAFGAVDVEDRAALIKSAEEGDADAIEELRTNDTEAIKAMIEALEDDESRELITLGMMLNSYTLGPLDDDDRASFDPNGGSFEELNVRLDGVKEQLEQQISRIDRLDKALSQ